MPVTNRMVETVLRRHATGPVMPEIDLIISILASAITDIALLPGHGDHTDTSHARNFVKSAGCVNYCDAVGLSHEVYLETLERACKYKELEI